MSEVVPTETELSDSQREHWEQQLIHAEKAVEVAKRMLGIIKNESTEDGESTVSS